MHRIITSFAYLIITLTVLSVYGWAVKHYAEDNAFAEFVGFLDVFETAVEEVQTLPKTFLPTPSDFEEVNLLTQDVNALVSFTNESNDRTVQILNLKDESVKWEWNIKNPFQAHNRILNPLVLPGKRLVYGYLGNPNIWCVDSTGVELWKQKNAHNHHSLNLDHDGNIWVCDYENGSYALKHGSKYTIIGSNEGHQKEISFIDNFITLLDEENGEVLYKKSVSDILIENGLEYILLKSPSLNDPLHLNDIEPVLEDGPFWNQGDVFLSFRTNSTVLHYRPSTGEVVKVLEGPFHSQHDVDILSDSTIGIFNNNGHTLNAKQGSTTLLEKVRDLGIFASHIVEYNYSSNEYITLEKETFEENKIATYTEGLFQYLPDGSVFIEEQNCAVMWILNDGEVVYKNVLESQHEGHHHLLNWTRILD